jgi:hypothetical protein
VFISSQFLQAIENLCLMISLRLLNILYCVMLPMGLIYALYFLSIFSELFHIIRINISVGMPLAYIRGVRSVTLILRERVAHLAARFPGPSETTRLPDIR